MVSVCNPRPRVRTQVPRLRACDPIPPAQPDQGSGGLPPIRRGEAHAPRTGPCERVWLVAPTGERKSFGNLVDCLRWANARRLIGCHVVGAESGNLLATIVEFSWSQLVALSSGCPAGRATVIVMTTVSERHFV